MDTGLRIEIITNLHPIKPTHPITIIGLYTAYEYRSDSLMWAIDNKFPSYNTFAMELEETVEEIYQREGRVYVQSIKPGTYVCSFHLIRWFEVLVKKNIIVY